MYNLDEDAHKSCEPEAIPTEVLINLHTMGFKLVPLFKSGVPNVDGLLFPEEVEQSIKESADGKPHPVNYIYDHPAFWNEDRIAKEASRFRNVATIFGKTHKRDDNGAELYLNVLDIDSQAVYDLLFNLQNPDTGDKYSLFPMLQKNTVLTKTKKRFGWHVYWLSHHQNKSISSMNCLKDHEFEIKTTNTMCTLPSSTHREDREFVYQNYGQNVIVVQDKLYVKINDILSDCLSRKKIDESISRDDSCESEHLITLSDDDKRFFHETVMPYYKKPYRHMLCLGLSGLFHKHFVSNESGRPVIEVLARKDEERDLRLLAFDNTYNKKREQVSGYCYLLRVLELSIGDRYKASEITAKLVDKLAAYYHGQKQEQRPEINDEYKNAGDYVVELAADLSEKFIFKTMRDTEEVYYYDEYTGIYNRSGEQLIKEQLEFLRPDIKTKTVNEVIQKIKRRTYTKRDEFDAADPYIINVQNGLLDVRSGELISHSSDYLFTLQLPIRYDPTAKCPLLCKFLAQVLKPGQFFTALQFLGYLLSGSCEFEKAVMLYGSGDNGKSVFIRLVEAFVGLENTSHVSLQELATDRFAAADLYAKIVNTLGDLQSEKILDTAMFKKLVTGDSIRAQFKYSGSFSFRNHAKLIFSANKIPESYDKSHAYFKRWIILQFPRTFTGSSIDRKLVEKITTSGELSGLLNLAIIGLRQLMRDGEFRLVKIEEVKQIYEEKSNNVKAFLDKRCDIDLEAPEYCTATVVLYSEYQRFCSQSREQAMDNTIFGKRLNALGIERRRLRDAGDREYYYLGVKLKVNELEKRESKSSVKHTLDSLPMQK
jgi:P4 family phage/plasmid primase-like protien